MENTHTQKVLKEFDEKIDSSNFPVGKYHHLEGEHLLDPEWYPESQYEIDPEKVKDLITSALASRDEIWRKRIEGKRGNLRAMNKTDPLGFEQIMAYSQALDDLLAVEGDLLDKK